jgi:hypothetical protein
MDLCRRFKVPPTLRKDDALAVTVLPLAIKAKQLKKESRIVKEGKVSPCEIIDTSARHTRLRYHPNYCRAIRALEFPKWLHDHMSRPDRAYCIWNIGADFLSGELFLETNWLISILARCRAKNVGFKADVRVVFVHVGSLKTLHNLMALAERRTKRYDIQFITYGTHHSVPPERWGIREIYPLGMSFMNHFF